MDIFNRFGVNGQNSLYVTGIGKDHIDEEIITVLKINGDISKIVRIPDESGQPEGRALIEYPSNRSISRIDPITLGTLPSPKDPNVLWSARTNRNICQEEMGREIAHRYLCELEFVAGSSRAEFLSVLQRELQRNQDPSSNMHSIATRPHATQDRSTTNRDQNEPAEATHVHSAPTSVPASPAHISENVFNRSPPSRSRK